MYLHEWLMFMVNVAKYTIHGCYVYLFIVNYAASVLPSMLRSRVLGVQNERSLHRRKSVQISDYDSDAAKPTLTALVWSVECCSLCIERLNSIGYPSSFELLLLLFSVVSVCFCDTCCVLAKTFQRGCNAPLVWAMYPH